MKKDDIIEVIERYKQPSKVAEMAVNRHSFGISREWGVKYSTNDVQDTQLKDINIPKDHVLICGNWNKDNQFEYIIHENEYLEILKEYLANKGLKKQSKMIKKLINKNT